MLKNTLLLCFVLTCASSYAQYYKSYDWNPKPEHHIFTTDENNTSSTGVLKKKIIEYYAESNPDNPEVFETYHTITRVMDERGIDRHNTIYIPMYDVKNVLNIKARTISKDGRVTLLQDENIKDISNVDEYGDFKIFAIEGAEKDSEIEVLYTLEKYFDLYGTENIQSNYPIQRAEILFITGDLNSKIKVYNSDKQFETIEQNGIRMQQLVINNLPELVNEEYSSSEAQTISVAYQCYPKGQTITQDMFWNSIVYNLGEKLFLDRVPTTIQNDMDIIFKNKKSLTQLQKAARIDNFIKTNFTVIKNNNEELSDLDYALANRMASDFGIVKVYLAFLKAANIEAEVVITSNRFTHKFDPDFFIPTQLRNFLIYLPSEDKYMAPDRIEYRVGEAPLDNLGNYGIYIKSSLEYYFSLIIQADPNYSTVKRSVDISFNNDFESATLIQRQEYTGHWALQNRAILALSQEASIIQFKDYLTGSGIQDKEILKFELKHEDMNQTEDNLPLIVESTIETEAIIEEAGDSFLFQVGLVIGTQSELYQEEKRVHPIEMEFPNQYDYEITIKIPKGYKAEGLDSLVLNKSYLSKSTNEVLCKFESNYKVKGDKIIIQIQEFYKSVQYDFKRYEEFRSVINAASDFNKAVIVFKAK